MKESDVTNILERIYLGRQISRTELAEQAGFALSYTSTLVGALLKQGWLEEAGLAPSKGGRRRVLLQLNPEMGHLIGIDVGRMNFRVVLTNILGEVLESRAFPLEVAEEEYVIERLRAEISRCLRQSGKVRGIGIAQSGVIDRRTGTVLFWPKVKGWHNVPLKKILEEKYKLPVVVDDSTRTMAISEQRFGQGNGIPNFVFVSIGMGIGSAIFIDGKLYAGLDGLAGELGHTTIDLNGTLCSCGNRGCLEVYASGTAILKRMNVELANGVTSSFTEIARSGDLIEKMADAASAGDRLSQIVLSDAGSHLGTALANIVNWLNPRRIILGGAVARNAGPLWFESVLRALRARAFQQSMSQVDVLHSSLDDTAGAVGAVVMLVQEMLATDRHRLKGGVRTTAKPEK